MEKNLVTTNDLCERFGVCMVTISRWRKSGCPFIKKGRNVYFKMDDVLRWIGDNYEVKEYNYSKNEEKVVN